jgi:hypothetical protein
VSDEVWRAAGVDPAAKPTAIAVWQDSLLADRIAKYFSGEKACVVSEICEECRWARALLSVRILGVVTTYSAMRSARSRN